MAVVNDTVGTMMTCGFDDQRCEVGIIVGKVITRPFGGEGGGIACSNKLVYFTLREFHLHQSTARVNRLHKHDHSSTRGGTGDAQLTAC